MKRSDTKYEQKLWKKIGGELNSWWDNARTPATLAQMVVRFVLAARQEALRDAAKLVTSSAWCGSTDCSICPAVARAIRKL